MCVREKHEETDTDIYIRVCIYIQREREKEISHFQINENPIPK